MRLFCAALIVSLLLPACIFAQTQAVAQIVMPTVAPMESSILIASGIGCSPTNIGSILWDVEVLFALPVLQNNSRLWIGIIPTMNPLVAGDETAADGFVPLVVEYEYDVAGRSSIPFVFANAGTGLEFGDRSNHVLAQAMMVSAGVGLHASVPSGFFGTVGATYNTVLSNSPIYFVLNAGIAF